MNGKITTLARQPINPSDKIQTDWLIPPKPIVVDQHIAVTLFIISVQEFRAIKITAAMIYFV